MTEPEIDHLLQYDDYRMACTMCYPDWEYVCDFGPYQLYRDGPEGTNPAYYLMCEPAHRDDYVLSLPRKPTVDPIPDELADVLEEVLEDRHPLWIASSAWIDGWIEQIKYNITDPVSHWRMVEEFTKLGYGHDRFIEYWIIDELARAIEKEENA